MADLYQAPSDVYFATIKEPAQLASAILGKITVWRNFVTENGLNTLWKRKISNYYGASENGNRSNAITQGGSEGELSNIKVNDLHNLIQGQLVIVTGERPAGVAMPSNADTASLKASMIGSAVSEYYMVNMNFEKKFISCAEIALLCDEGFTELWWDPSIGEDTIVNEDNTSALKSGDSALSVHAPWYVARDPSCVVDNQKWHIVSFRVNKFDMAASHPDHAEQILNATEVNIPDLGIDKLFDGTDMIWAHRLIHDRTPAASQGRYVLLVGDTVVEDDPKGLPFDFYPIDRMAPSDVIDGCVGYSASNDILAMEQVSDALYSALTTNELSFAVQNIIGPEGANINVPDIAKGVRYFEVNPQFVDKIKPLQLSASSPTTYNLINLLGGKKEQMVGANSVTRGQPEGKLAGASGAALALVQAQAISFNSGTQRSFFKIISSVMTKNIMSLQENMTEDKLIQIVGKMQTYGIKEFKISAKDLRGISAVTYTAVDPISQTVGGKLALADALLSKPGMIQSPKQYLTIAKTGNLDPMTQDSEMIQMTILEENENLRDGKPVVPVVTENHADHIKSHNALLTPEVKLNKTMTLAITDHIQGHVDLWQKASMNNPAILMATNQQILQPGLGLPMMPPPPGGAPGPGGPGGAPNGTQSPPPPPGNPAQGPMNGQPPQNDLKKNVGLPNFPDIAGTKNKPVIPGVTT